MGDAGQGEVVVPLSMEMVLLGREISLYSRTSKRETLRNEFSGRSSDEWLTHQSKKILKGR
jgi:hypothetical protein